MFVLYGAVAFVSYIVIRSQFKAWGEEDEIFRNPSPDGIIQDVRKYSDPDLFRQLNPRVGFPNHTSGYHCHRPPDEENCHHHDSWPWRNGIVLSYDRQVVDSFTGFNLSFAPADTLPLMQVRCGILSSNCVGV